jgi:hypothetical protein
VEEYYRSSTNRVDHNCPHVEEPSKLSLHAHNTAVIKQLRV